MNDRDAFLRTIRESPDDDAPRLVFADWLEERGEAERAEFIRVQCDVARWRPCPNVALHRPPARCPECDRRSAVRRREAELLSRNAAAFLDGLPGRVAAGRSLARGRVEISLPPGASCDPLHPPVYTFRRGFAERLECSWPTWRSAASHLPAVHPLREVALATMPEVRTAVDHRNELVHVGLCGACVPSAVVGPWPWAAAWTWRKVQRMFWRWHADVIGNLAASGTRCALLEMILPRLAGGRFLRWMLGRVWPGIRFSLPAREGQSLPCPNCAGAGELDHLGSSRAVPCRTCNGTGTVSHHCREVANPGDTEARDVARWGPTGAP